MVSLGLPPYRISVFWLSIRNADINFFILHKYGNKHYTFAVVPTIYILFSPQEFLGPENIFFLFGAIAVLALVFVILNVPETKGLSLEEIESKILK